MEDHEKVDEKVRPILFMFYVFTVCTDSDRLQTVSSIPELPQNCATACFDPCPRRLRPWMWLDVGRSQKTNDFTSAPQNTFVLASQCARHQPDLQDSYQGHQGGGAPVRFNTLRFSTNSRPLDLAHGFGAGLDDQPLSELFLPCIHNYLTSM